MAKFVVIYRPSAAAPDSTAEVKVVDYIDTGGTQRENGIASIEKAFGERAGVYYYAPLSAFGSLTAEVTSDVSYT